MPRSQPKPPPWNEAQRSYAESGTLRNAEELGGLSYGDCAELTQVIAPWIPHSEWPYTEIWEDEIYRELRTGQGFVCGGYLEPTGYVSAEPILVLEAAKKGREVIWVTKVLTAPGHEDTFTALLNEVSKRFPEAYVAFMHYDSRVLDQVFDLGFTIRGMDPLVLETSIHIQHLLKLRSLPIPLPPTAAHRVQVLVRPPVDVVDNE